MPTILRLDGLRALIDVDDHRPAYVHVIAADGEAVFVLNCPDGPPELRERYGVSLQTVNRIQKELAKQLSVLCPKMEGDSWKFLSKIFRLRPFVAKNCGARVMRSC